MYYMKKNVFFRIEFSESSKIEFNAVYQLVVSINSYMQLCEATHM